MQNGFNRKGKTMPFIMTTPPPAPTNINEIPPSVGDRVLLNDPKQDPIPDVIAEPLYAFIRQDGQFLNFDRRAMNLQVYGQWNLVFATTISRDTPITQQLTEEMGIVTSSEEERSFAATIGVDLGVPSLNLGAMISTTLSAVTRQSIQTSSKTTLSTTFDATTDKPESTIWYWQLRLSYEVDGTVVAFAPRDAKAAALLTQNVNTNAGPGKQRSGGGAIPVRRFPGREFTQTLMVADQIFRTTQFPRSSAEVVVADAVGNKSSVPEFDSQVSAGDRQAA
ncbi:hypothetical protein DFR52_107102 [Hoeflea marina]|uniref:Uncharacterized protein n=1 Tax=Hoeflea marina TaxID=274592 RepID=A0A317PD51_9HYPH|nr:hypothetical protein [Hoeflea marina]PWV97190.1 hypothetical protein DFR52_107102 [Hoeflea marina]